MMRRILVTTMKPVTMMPVRPIPKAYPVRKQRGRLRTPAFRHSAASSGSIW